MTTPAGGSVSRSSAGPIAPRRSRRSEGSRPRGRSGLTILVLAKEPRPGTSKTRLAPAFGPDGAAALASAALADTLEAVAAAPAVRRVLVLAGKRIPFLPKGFDVVPQVDGGHGERIAAALAGASGPALLIGMDTPQITPALLAVDLGDPATGAWFGPAADGGWWALGLRHPDHDAHRVLAGVPMSTRRTGTIQRRRLIDAGLAVVDLPMLRDVDEPADAYAVAATAPHTRFARSVSRLTDVGCGGAR
jgi:glycosyltransferase A (GT-A) superfamily protein (DUF2064 family)